MPRGSPFGRPAPRSSPPLEVIPVPSGTEPALPRAILFHDSFGGHILPLLTADFRTVATVASRDLELPAVEAVRPAVVVQELVARRLYLEPPINPPAVKGYSKR